MRLPGWLFVGTAAVLLAGSPGVAGAQPVADPLAGSPGLGDPYYPLDGNGGYDVSHYEVDIDYDPAAHQLTGSTRIDATATQALTSFNLDFAGPQVTSVSVNNLPATFERHGEHELTIRPALPLLPWLPFTVTVDYAGVAENTKGAGWTYAPSGGAFAAGEPHSAATWYPLNDTPRDKATFTLHTTVPAEWEVVSNGVRTRDDVRAGARTVTWTSRKPVIGYLTTIAIDRFTYLEQHRADGTPLLSAFAPGVERHRELERRLPEILDFTESLYGPYPFETSGGIYIDTELPFSLETQTRPIYAPWTELQTVVHEIAHQWWGDSVSVYSWADICLNECFASYTADYLWPERMEGADVDAQYRETIRKWRDEPRFWEIPLENPGAGQEFTSVYYRGPLFLHALRKQLGDDVFFAALREFVTANAYGNASMPQLRTFIQSKTTEDLTGFFDAWLNRTTPPPDQYLYPGDLRS
ncbi:M1 family metallopeptidase [Nocardia donostiensis]|uniref:Aminopeptidase N n=1 Tax=Nocardia donostiensis TaxID=1538463 RepID=A0A1W0B6E3_9NOCA|nr:M1 family metallopeptidase [Nocardia donostiensis]ONM50385.1 peptidase [Nocardia donostiensis]OQS17381.1 peptidase [Nocardia donostiensis]OQS18082.1 peptidase [Nocardia donostiensis]